MKLSPLSIATLLGVALILLTAAPVDSVVTCPAMSRAFAPCVPSLIRGSYPGPICCSAVNNIRSMLVTAEDKRTACECAQSAVRQYPVVREDQVNQLLKNCNVHIDVPVSKDLNCNDIH